MIRLELGVAVFPGEGLGALEYVVPHERTVPVWPGRRYAGAILARMERLYELVDVPVHSDHLPSREILPAAFHAAIRIVLTTEHLHARAHDRAAWVLGLTILPPAVLWRGMHGPGHEPSSYVASPMCKVGGCVLACRYSMEGRGGGVYGPSVEHKAVLPLALRTG